MSLAYVITGGCIALIALLVGAWAIAWPRRLFGPVPSKNLSSDANGVVFIATICVPLWPIVLLAIFVLGCLKLHGFLKSTREEYIDNYDECSLRELSKRFDREP